MFARQGRPSHFGAGWTLNMGRRSVASRMVNCLLHLVGALMRTIAQIMAEGLLSRFMCQHACIPRQELYHLDILLLGLEW